MTPGSLDIFITKIYFVKLDTDLKLIKDFSFDLKKKTEGRKFTNVSGWQSNDLVNCPDYIENFKNLAIQHVNTYGKTMGINRDIIMDNIWVNINDYKDSNKAHIHPYSVISGVFYVQVPKQSGNIQFINPYHDLMNYGLKGHVDKRGPVNSPLATFPPNENILLLFPSWLSHLVEPNMNKNEPRISISFNTRYI